jgi:hypothetical protein
MSITAWQFASNTFRIVTEGSTSLMGEIFRDHAPKLAAAAAKWSDLVDVNNETVSLFAAWDAGEQLEINAEASQLSSTAAVEDKFASMTRKPDLDTNSPMESWDATIRSTVAFEGTTYTLLLPRGRATLTEGSNAQRIEALEGFYTRLKAQTAKPALVSLGNVVQTFYNQLNGLYTFQQTQIVAYATARKDLATLRGLVARQCYRNTGKAIFTWCDEVNNARIEGLFDMSLIREQAPEKPDQAALPVWAPAIRTLTVPALPDRATRLEAWRIGPGGAPELLAVGEAGATSVVIPAIYTFTSGSLYQLFVKGRNARGAGEASPSVSWTAP